MEQDTIETIKILTGNILAALLLGVIVIPWGIGFVMIIRWVLL